MRKPILIAALLITASFSHFAYSRVECKKATLSADVLLFNEARRVRTAETPGSIACVYGLTPGVPGCRIEAATTVPNGGWGVIAVTDGGHDPNALQELNTFSREFGLPTMTECASVDSPPSAPCFAVVYATEDGAQPPVATGKDLREHAIDIEMAHAMAPNASIIMVEAPSFSQSVSPTIFEAVRCASEKVERMGGGVISNSWSIPEYPTERDNDRFFQTPGIVYLGSSGDELAPARYPSSSPYLVSVGATEIVRDNNGNFVSETAWNVNGSGTSGGPSIYEPRPSFQNSVMKVVGKSRGTPDISIVGHNIIFYYLDNCTTTLPITCQANWLASSGTSFASPLMAGIINTANSRAGSSQTELNLIYNEARKNYHSYWHDLIQGNNGFPALQGYDFVGGLGTPLGYQGK